MDFDDACIDFVFLVKIKKFGEMARKLRFFKDQMEKAGVSPSTKSVTQADIDVDDLEVCWGAYYVACSALGASGSNIFILCECSS